MIAMVELNILNLLSTSFQIRIRCRGSSSLLFGVNIIVMAATSRILGLTELMESDSELNTRFNFGINVVAMASTSRTQLVSLFLKFLNLLFNVLNRRTKLQHDFVFRSLVFHNKMLFEEESKRSDSDVEFMTRFVFEIYVVAMASTSGTQISFEIILDAILGRI